MRGFEGFRTYTWEFPKIRGILFRVLIILLMDKILHDLKDSKLWELWYIPYNGYCRILSINSIFGSPISETPT